MPNSLNINALNQYADRFTAHVLKEAYRTKTVVEGADLLRITPVRQVNLGILNRLFDQWKGNALSFRSVYFDFENEEVKKALEAFMNTASQHISVKSVDIEPLLKESIVEGLKLLYTPEAYFDEKFKALPGRDLTTASLQQLVKYTHIHNGIAKSLESRFAESGSDSVPVSRAQAWLQEILSTEEMLDDKAFFEQQFSEIVALDPSDMLAKANEPAVPYATPKQEPKSFFDSALSDMESAKTVPVGQRAQPGMSVLSEIVSQTSSPEKDSLNNRFKVEMPKQSEESAYGSVQVKVESIANTIPLGQRFMFVNQLFSKNSEHFEKAIYELDSVKSYAEAEDLIWHRYASKHAWDVNGEAVSALLAIVKRKFS